MERLLYLFIVWRLVRKIKIETSGDTNRCHITNNIYYNNCMHIKNFCFNLSCQLICMSDHIRMFNIEHIFCIIDKPESKVQSPN